MSWRNDNDAIFIATIALPSRQNRVKIVVTHLCTNDTEDRLVDIPQLSTSNSQPASEERDENNVVTKRFFTEGEQINGAKYFYTRDHLGSVRELTDVTGAIRARYDYDPYGRRTKVQGDLDADFGFTGHYVHARSGLHLALYRAYDADTGRWLNRDPIGEEGGLNLYAYVHNDSINDLDPLGLCRNKGESFFACLDRYARGFYGRFVDLTDNLGYYGLASAAAGLAMYAGTTLIDKVARNSAKDAQIAAAKKECSMLEKRAIAKAGAAKAARLGILRGVLAGVSKISTVVATAATAFSVGARAVYVGDCMEECP